MVDRPFEPGKWQTDSSVGSRHSDRIGCFQHWMGSMLQGFEDERSMVQGGIMSPYQLQGNAGSFSCTAVICEGQPRCPCQTQGGQHNNNVLHQPHGGNTLPSVDGVNFTDMDVVSGQEVDVVSRAFTRQIEPGCRSGIQDAGRQLRVEDESKGIQPLDEASRAMFGGSICISTDSPVGPVHELEARSRGNGHGCPVSTVDTHTGLHFSSVFTHWTMPDESTAGESTQVVANSTNVADTALVPSTAVNGDHRANGDSIISRSATEPQGRASSTSDPGFTESSRVVSVRGSLNKEGISEGATKLILASWRANTEQSYSCCWRRWESWCAENGHEAINSPLSNILDFLASQYEQEKQYRTINSYRSAISMTHAPIEGVVVGKHPLVSRLMKGIYNQRPPQPRYTSTWDVQVVLDHVRGWGSTASLGRKQLSQKLAMLMALANASRCSELHALDVGRMRFNEHGVTFSLAELIKTSKPGKSKILFYPFLASDKELCPVVTLKEYLSKTVEDRKESKLFLSYVRPYNPVKPCSIARWLKEILVETGYQDFRAHSTRGAAVSAAYSQGMSVADIIKIADWSSDNMFRRYYHKTIVNKQNASFSHSFISD